MTTVCIRCNAPASEISPCVDCKAEIEVLLASVPKFDYIADRMFPTTITTNRNVSWNSPDADPLADIKAACDYVASMSTPFFPAVAIKMDTITFVPDLSEAELRILDALSEAGIRAAFYLADEVDAFEPKPFDADAMLKEMGMVTAKDAKAETERKQPAYLKHDKTKNVRRRRRR